MENNSMLTPEEWKGLPLKIANLEQKAGAKWQAVYRSATSTGVWFIAFAASLALGKWSDGVGIVMGMCALSFAVTFTMGLLMIGAMLEAQTVSRELTAATKLNQSGTAA